MMVKTVCAGRKKCHGDNEKYLAANICHLLIRALQICSYKYAPLAAARHSPSASLASALALRKRFSCLKLHLVLAYFAKQSLQSGGG